MAGLSEFQLCKFSVDDVAWADISEVAEILWQEYEQQGPSGGRRLVLIALIFDLVNKLWDDYARDDPGGYFECRTHDPAAPLPAPDCADGDPCEHGVRWDWVDAPPDLWSGPTMKLYLDRPERSPASHVILSPRRGVVLAGQYARAEDALLLGRHVRTALAWEQHAYRIYHERARARRAARRGVSASSPPP